MRRRTNQKPAPAHASDYWVLGTCIFIIFTLFIFPYL